MKRINLDQMKNMSIDNLIESYRSGYRLEEHAPITSLSYLPNFSNIRMLQGPLLDPVVNFGKVTVSIGYDTVATSIILNTNEGYKLPDPSSGAFNLVWWNSTDYPDPSDDPNKEIVRCTARTTDTLTVIRAQEGTSASIKNLVGKTYKMILSPTAKMMSDISSAITARVVKSGDTMTGILNLPSNGLIVGTNQLVTSGGNVGIGTTSPSQRLEVNGNISIPTGNKYIVRSVYPDYDYISYGVGGTDTWSFMMHAYAAGMKWFTWDGAAIIERMYLDSSGNLKVSGIGNSSFAGNVGIGTATPTSLLDVNGTVQLRGITSGTGLTVDAGGKVGIGTTSPNTMLEILKTASGALGPTLRLTNGGGGIGAEADIEFYDDQPMGKIKFIRTSVGSAYTDLAFATHKSDVDGVVEHMRITNAGNIGIGTMAPGGKLELKGIGNHLVITDDASANKQWIMRVNSSGLDINEPGFGSRLFVKEGGNVGIGTTTPGKIFDVVSNIGNPQYCGGGIEVDGVYTTKLHVTSQSGYESYISKNASTGIMTIHNGHSGGYINIEGGNVGIGTTGPTNKLEVNGRTATVGFTNTGSITSYNDVDGSTIMIQADNAKVPYYATGQVTNAILQVAANRTGVIAVRNGTSANFVYEGFDASTTPVRTFYVTGTGNGYFNDNVGIGTSTPGYKLEVNGIIYTTGYAIGNGIALGQNKLWMSAPNDDNHYISLVSPGGIGYYDIYGHYFLGSNVGIGTTSPATILDVNGNIRLGASYTDNVDRFIGIGNGGTFGVDGSTAIEFKSVTIGGNYSQSIYFWCHHYGASTGGTPRMIIRYDGNVGIGTIIPGEKLDIAGNINLTGHFTGTDHTQSYINILKNGNFESWSAGASATSDGWGFPGWNSGTITRESVNVKYGTYSAKMTTGAANSGQHYQSLVPILNQIKGRTLTLGAWIKSDSSRTTIHIYDNVGGSAAVSHSGNNQWEFLTVTKTIDVSATDVYVSVPWVLSGDATTTYIDGAILVEGSVCPTFSPRALYDDGNTLQIDSTNNRVGIGTTSPGAKLDIQYGTTSDQLRLSEQGGFVSYKIGRNNADGLLDFEGQQSGYTGYNFKGYGGTSRLYIKGSDGNVGIGTTSPSQTLEVNGDMKVVTGLVIPVGTNKWAT